MKSRILVLALIVIAALGGKAVGTPVIGTITAETARGAFAENLDLKSNFANGARVGIHTKGPIELIAQRIVAEPGSSFGWHSHPGENVNVVLQGTLTLYHDEHCTVAVEYGPGEAFSTSPEEIHLAHNNGTETLILFATYFAPLTSPPQAVRIDQPLPSEGCPV
jgi:quercetin dioxygenase-like cupin family protein